MDPKVVQDHSKAVRSRFDIMRRHGIYYIFKKIKTFYIKKFRKNNFFNKQLLDMSCQRSIILILVKCINILRFVNEVVCGSKSS
ncbi:hypothetical protein BpHYR1_010930 [Brachionus plicatilis]|uniref:Uncharacterized protein n=1 Tax=Brachionus plicatilis TaxID=10195 RepID=A0A3M7QV46_BRAPC|nr:hypothetical protein BpHYR1_010930 [Brachionus plicatilis]